MCTENLVFDVGRMLKSGLYSVHWTENQSLPSADRRVIQSKFNYYTCYILILMDTFCLIYQILKPFPYSLCRGYMSIEDLTKKYNIMYGLCMKLIISVQSVIQPSAHDSFTARSSRLN